MTVVELCARYWKYAKRYYQKDGKSARETPNIRLALKLVRACYGTTVVSEFGPLALKAIRQCMIDQNLSRQYVNAQIGRVKRMFKWGVAEELVPASVLHGLMAVSGLCRGRSEALETDPVQPVGDDVVEATLPFMSPIVGDMVRLQRLAGMRPAEVCLRCPIDIDRMVGFPHSIIQSF